MSLFTMLIFQANTQKPTCTCVMNRNNYIDSDLLILESLCLAFTVFIFKEIVNISRMGKSERNILAELIPISPV